MNNARIRIGCCLLPCFLLAACGVSDGKIGNSILRLPACSDIDTPFEGVSLDAARETFHATVTTVVNAHIAAAGESNTLALTCTANDYRGLLQPSKELTDLATLLPEWGPTRTATLSEADIGSVLLEYLRVYECTLYKRSQFLVGYIQDEQSVHETLASGEEIEWITRSDLTAEEGRQSAIVQEELLTARPAVERTIAFIGSVDRLRPLSAELECLKRASLDVRNALGLMAEAASCLPKIWDARGSLRDLPD